MRSNFKYGLISFITCLFLTWVINLNAIPSFALLKKPDKFKIKKTVTDKTTAVEKPSIKKGTYRKDRILIKFKKTVAVPARSKILSKHGFTIKKSFKHTGIQLVSLPPGKSVEESLSILSKDPGFEYAEPDHLYSIAYVPNDNMFDDLWGLHNTGQTGGKNDADIDAPEAWDLETGDNPEEIVVAVIDTGVDFTHKDLADNLWTNAAEAGGVKGVDDDGNGYIDDIYGINAITGSGSPYDDHSHGTHVSGTIAAKGDNNTGVAGVCWGGGVKIMALKSFDSSGYGWTSDAVTCIEYMLDMINKGVNIKVSSNSWGGLGYDISLYNAISALRDKDVLFVAAAGNSAVSTDIFPHYPSAYDFDNIISVAATANDDKLGWYQPLLSAEPHIFSNYGPISVDVGAPGVDILSTIPGYLLNDYIPAPGDIFFDDVESGEGNWNTEPPWGITSETAHSGTSSWTDSPGGEYTNDISTSLTSEIIDLSGYTNESIMIGFYGLLRLEEGWDFIYIEVTGDDGATWSKLRRVSEYNITWRLYNFEIPARFKTTQFRFRIRFDSDHTITADGVYIDDIGIGISTQTGSSVFYDDMETGESNWFPESTWAITDEMSFSGNYAWSDSPEDNTHGGSYSITSKTIDLSEVTAPFIFLNFYAWVETVPYQEGLSVKVSNDGTSWTELEYLSRRGTQMPDWYLHTCFIPDEFRTNTFRLRFTLEGAGPGVRYDGVYIDDVSIKPGLESNRYEKYTGTSMATPHVAGLASLILSYRDGLTYDKVKDIICATVDPLTDLYGKILTGGRINANSALLQDPLDLPPIIYELLPTQIPTGGRITLKGSNFGDTLGQVTVSPGLDAAIESWSDTRIVMTVPSNAESGPVYITTSDAKNSNSVFLAIGDYLKMHSLMPKGVYRHAVAATDTKIYSIGGYSDLGYFETNLVQIYDPFQDYWTYGANKPTPVAEAAAAVIDGKIYVAGGYQLTTEIVINNLEIYDTATDTWDTSKAPLPEPLCCHGAVSLNGKLYVIGGQTYNTGAGLKFPYVTSLYRYDTSTDTWEQLQSMSESRINFAVAVLNEKIFVYGGFTPGSVNGIQSSGEVYDPVTDTWTPIAPMNIPRYDFAGAACDGKLYAIGGNAHTNRDYPPYQADIEVYDPVTDTWQADNHVLNKARQGLRAVTFNSSYLYIMGGYAGAEALSYVEILSSSFTDPGDYVPVIITYLTANPTAGAAPLTVDFTISATGGSGDLSYAWDFGDGSTSNEQNPSHEYTEPGDYIVTVAVYDKDDINNSSVGELSVILLESPDTISIQLVASPISGFAPLDVTFYIKILSLIEGPYTIVCDFGDGTEEQCTTDNTTTEMTHTYDTSGTYQVWVMVSAPSGIGTKKNTVESFMSISVDQEPDDGSNDGVPDVSNTGGGSGDGGFCFISEAAYDGDSKSTIFKKMIDNVRKILF